MTIANNSEILFLYDAKRTNPNGDMDNENKPRMDTETETNLVSDVRLKRYIRDYLELFKGKELFITDKAKDSGDRAKQLKDEKKKHEDCIDVKLFGAVLAESGANTHFVGPIQFTWGYSLNRVELQETKTITSKFSSGVGVGKDFRVNYSFLAFSGSINAKNAEPVALSDEDLKLFDEAMVKSIPLSRTRSKIGQTPRLYLRVEMKNANSYLKDLREYIKLDRHKNYDSIDDVELDCKELIDYLKANKEKISKLVLYKDDKLTLTNWDISNFEMEEFTLQ